MTDAERIAELESENARLRAEHTELQEMHFEQARTIRDLRAENERLEQFAGSCVAGGGDLVRENARLKAERESILLTPGLRIRAELNDVKAENARLRAENEELKAWRALACYLFGRRLPELCHQDGNDIIESVRQLANEEFRKSVGL